MAKMGHQIGKVLRHHTLAVAVVIVAALRLFAVAIAAQVCSNAGELRR
ncbi:Uncharacterised protein [Mycobacteroides abscessus subsp. abscessus]|nr:Uncharacterised protein [Mycobacteroides abscessus subsp. abscessus]